MTTDIERELESLLRGEISAAETYKQVLENMAGPEAQPLRDIQQEHGEAIRFLKEQLTARGHEAPTSSGTWGVFAKSVEGAAKLFGDKAALTALREGERSGLSQYEKALASGALPADCTTHIGSRLIPAQRRHIAVLDEHIARA